MVGTDQGYRGYRSGSGYISGTGYRSESYKCINKLSMHSNGNKPCSFNVFSW